MHQREIVDLFCRELELPLDVWRQFQTIERAMLDVLRGTMNWHELDELFACARIDAKLQARAMVGQKYPLRPDEQPTAEEWSKIASEYGKVYTILLPQCFAEHFSIWRQAQDRRLAARQLAGVIVFPVPKPQV